MKLRYLILVTVALVLAGCSAAQLTAFQASVNNFINGVHSVDAAVASVNSTLYKNCGDTFLIGQAVATLPKTCSKAALAMAGINASIANYCQASQVTDIKTAIAGSAAAYAAGKAAYADARSACR